MPEPYSPDELVALEADGRWTYETVQRLFETVRDRERQRDEIGQDNDYLVRAGLANEWEDRYRILNNEITTIKAERDELQRQLAELREALKYKQRGMTFTESERNVELVRQLSEARKDINILLGCYMIRCNRKDHKPVRFPLCKDCQADARAEEVMQRFRDPARIAQEEKK